MKRTGIKLLLLLLHIIGSSIGLNAQKIITGTVTGEDGVPIPGVNVIIKETSAGTITDVDGEYSITVPSDDAILVYSFVGMITQEHPVAGVNEINVILIEDTKSLDEVVVIGYGKRKRETISAAISTIETETIVRGTDNTVAGQLVSKVSGITSRQKYGIPGQAPRIQIRNSGEPLFVIDGVMTDISNFNNLDPNDIENITILKDGSAAIYGVKAANGVILVTTKRGQLNQRTTVNFNTRAGIEEWTMFPRLLNAYEWNYAQYMREVNKGELGVPVEVARAELEKWKEGYYNPETGEDYRGFDYIDEYVNPAPHLYSSLNISGGTEKTNYYISAAHVNQDAVYKDFNFNRSNAGISVDTKLSDRLKVGYQVKGRNESRTGPGLRGGNDYERVLSSLYNIPPIYRPYANNNPDYIYDIPFRRGNNPAGYDIEHSGLQDNNLLAVQNIWTLTYETPWKGLTANGLFSLDYRNRTIDNFEKGWKSYRYDAENDVYNVTYDMSASGHTTLESITEKSNYQLGQFLLNYTSSFSSLHEFNATAGFEYTDTKYNYIQVHQSPVENEFIPLLGTNENNTVNERERYTSTASFVFRAGYSFANKYVLDFAGRYDGSWRFPPGKRWGFFPSISASWQISSEDFIQNSSISNWLTFAKLRFSYGEMGDDNVGSDFFYLEGYNYGSGSSYFDPAPWSNAGSTRIIGSAPKGVPNTNLSWMAVSILNVGLDLWFIDHLNVQVDAFKRKRQGIPAVPDDIMFPIETGLDVLTENLNSDGVLGIDGQFRWEDRKGDVSWYAAVNWTFARRKNFDYYGEKFQNSWDQYRWSRNNRWANVDGSNWLAAQWMWHTTGVFQSYEEIENYPIDLDGRGNATIHPGDLKKQDCNGDGIIDDYDERVLGFGGPDYPWDDFQGNRQPILSVGINMGFEYKGIDVAADFAGGYLNTFTPDWGIKVGLPARNQNGLYVNNIDVWRHEDIFDPSSPWVPGTYPSIRDWQSNAASMWNDFYVRNVNYMRLRNLVVGYTFPARWTQKVSIQKLRIYFQGKNLFFVHNSLSGYLDIDPEISTVNVFDYPQHKGYSFGIDVTF